MARAKKENVEQTEELKKVYGSEKEATKVETPTSEEEKAILENIRKNKKRKEDCANEIMSILKKYRANITVDPNSPIGKPSLIIQLYE